MKFILTKKNPNFILTSRYSRLMAALFFFTTAGSASAQAGTVVVDAYIIEVTSGEKPEEIYWALIDDLVGDTIAQGGAPYINEEGTLFNNTYITLYMEDAGGDGWNGAEFSIYSPYADVVTTTETLDAPMEPLGPGEIQTESRPISFFTEGWQGDCNQVFNTEEYLALMELFLGDSYFDTNSPFYWEIIYDDPYCCYFGWDGWCHTQYLALVAANAGKECWTAVKIEPAVVFNDSRVNFDISAGGESTGFDCAVADNGQKEYWFRFTAEHTHSLISARREGTGNFNAAIEVYDGCGGSLVLCQDDYTSANEVAVFPTEIGQQYTFKVYHNGETLLNNSTVSVAVAFVPTTELSAADCGRMNLTDADIIRSNWPPNQFLLANWMFEFKELEAPYNTYHVISPNGSNPQFRWFWFPQREPGRTYEVRTRPRMYQGPTWADWGASCVIGTAPAAPGQPAGLVQSSGSSASASNEIGIQLWPNPAQNEVNISFRPAANDQVADISIFDISGKEVDRLQYGFDRGVFQNIVYTNEKLDAGIYLFHIRTESGTSVARLVVTK